MVSRVQRLLGQGWRWGWCCGLRGSIHGLTLTKDGYGADMAHPICPEETAIQQELARDLGIPVERLSGHGKEQLASLVVHLTKPDGALFGGGTPGRLERSTPELLYVGTQGAQGRVPNSVLEALPAGAVVGRSGWGEYAVPFGEETFYTVVVQGSPDWAGAGVTGSVTCAALGQDWLVGDAPQPCRPGSYPEGDHLSVDLPQDFRRRGAALVRCVHRPEMDEVVIGTDECREGEPRLTRQVAYHRGGALLVVLDTVEASGQIRLTQTWPVAEVLAQRVPHGFQLSAGGFEAHLLWPGAVDIDREEGVPTLLRGTRSGRGRVQIATVFAPVRRGGVELVSARYLARGISLRVRVGRQHHDLSLGPQRAQTRRVDDFQAARRSTMVSRIAERPVLGDRPGEPDGDLLRRARETVGQGGDSARRRDMATRLARRFSRLAPVSAADFPTGLLHGMIDVLGPEGMAEPGWEIGALAERRSPLLAAPGSSVPLSRYDGVVQRQEEALERLSMQGDRPVFGAFVRGDLVMPWCARPGVGATLVVRLHGALNRTRVELPYFPELPDAVARQEPFLLVQDPSLDHDAYLSLAWYLGSSWTDGHGMVADLVRQVREALGVKRAVVTGGSGGGFAALHVAALEPMTSALAFDPQVDLRRYHPHVFGQAARLCLGVEDPTTASPSRVSVVSRWLERRHPIDATIVSNTGDTAHDLEHVGLLEREVRGMGGDVRMVVHRTERASGHHLPSSTARERWIDLVLAGRGGNSPEDD